MASKKPIDTAKELLKRFGTSLVKSIPAVQGYNAVKQMATPQYRQSANNLYQGALKLTPSYQISKAMLQPTGIKPVDYITQRVGNYVKNNYYQPLADLPTNINKSFSKGTPALDRGLAMFNTAMTPLYALPDPTDALMGVFNAAKGYSAGKLRGGDFKQNIDIALKSASLENPIGLGTSVTTNPLAEQVLNIAEFPLLLTAGIVNKKSLDDNARMVSKAVKSGQLTADEGKVLYNLLRGKKNMFQPQQLLEKNVSQQPSTKAGLYDTKPINTKYMDLTPEQKVYLDNIQTKIAKDLDEIRGGKLTHEEVLQRAQQVAPESKILNRADVLDMEAKLTRAKQSLLALNEELGNLEVNKKNLPLIKQKTKEVTDLMKIIKSRGTSAGRLLESQKIKISPEAFDSNAVRLSVLKLLDDSGIEASKYLDDAAKVNWNNAKSVTEFYRKYKPATLLEKFNEYRYGNMLSNPKTQWKNVWSNLIQTFYTTPVTERVSGNIKNLPSYYKGLFNGLADATDEFMSTMKGEALIQKPDIPRMPTTSKTTVFQIPGKLMEGSDRFFRTLITSGLEEGGFTPSQARKTAEYSLFRAPLDPKNKTGQGYLLSGIDALTQKMENLRRDMTIGGKKVPNPVGWFIPFIRTGMNVAKQWIEYSPLGLATLPGNRNKTEQLAKMVVAVPPLILGAMKAANNESTWQIPSDPEAKQLFYAEGKKPFSVKIGNAWVPMNNFGVFAYALAFPAALNYYQSESREALTDTQAQKISKAVLGITRLFVDQTWMEGLSSFVRAVSGREDYTIGTSLAFNFGQAIPMNGLVNFITRLVDPVYRKASTFKEGVQRGLPFVSKSLPAYTTPTGEESKRVNSIFPYDIGKNDSRYRELFKYREKELQVNNLYNTIENLVEDGKIEEARKVIRRFKKNLKKDKQSFNPFEAKEVSAAEAKPGELGPQLEQPLNYRAVRNADGSISILYEDGTETGPLNEQQYRRVSQKLIEYNKGVFARSRGLQPQSQGIGTSDAQRENQQLGVDIYNDIIDEIWGDQAENAKIILSRENAGRQTGKEMDIPNRIGENGQWDNNAPIKKGEDPFTKKQINSIDRGLFRINNITFLTWLSGVKERQLMYEAGIIDKPYEGRSGLTAEERERLWDRMLDPYYNTKFAKLLYDNWGPNQWAVVRNKLVTLK